MRKKTSAKARVGRPRDFDEASALEAAMRVFWAKSYEGATMSELTKAMRINRSSMYAAFGGKQALYHLALARYTEGPMRYIGTALEQPTVRAVVQGLVNGTADFLSLPGNPAGCLSIQGALACGTDSQPIKRAMVQWRARGEAAIEKRLQRAKKDGELDSAANPADLARYLSAVMSGLGVQAANGATKSQMKRIAAMTLRFMGC